MSVYTHEEIAVFAETNFRGVRRRFGIKTDDRRKHMYMIGKTGMGKSTTLENLIISDIRNGHGVGIIDPHGDLAEKILDYIPPSRINDVIYFNPADLDFPIAFNILETIDPKYKHLVASGMMGVFKKIWPDVWSARMEYILNNTILALLDNPGSTMLGINRMLAERDYRKKVLVKVKDPVVKAFWVEEFEKWEDRFRKEAVAAIQNKVGQFLSASIIRNIVGQVKSTIDMREIMDGQKIFIMNLAKGRIGEDASALLGGMLITRIQLAAMGRVDIPEKERKDFYFYVDEFQNFATLSFANILSEARKYRLALILAHQYIEQLEEEVAAAVFGNVGTMMAFRVGAADAEILEKEFAPVFTGEDLVNLSKFDMYLKLMIDGVASSPFSASGLPPVSGETGSTEKVIKVSRERYAKPVEIVEEKIIRWSGMQIEKTDEELEEEIRKDIADKKYEKEEKAAITERENEKDDILEEKNKSKELEELAIKAREAMFLEPKVRAVNFLEKLEEMEKGESELKLDQVDEGKKLAEPLELKIEIKEEKKTISPPKARAQNVSPEKSKEKKVKDKKDEGKTYEEKFPFKITCSLCGEESRVSFDPDPSRPVYCKDCLKIGKEKERQAKNNKKQKV